MLAPIDRILVLELLSDPTKSLRTLNTQLYYALVMLCKDDAHQLLRNTPRKNGAEAWRKRQGKPAAGT